MPTLWSHVYVEMTTPKHFVPCRAGKNIYFPGTTIAELPISRWAPNLVTPFFNIKCVKITLFYVCNVKLKKHNALCHIHRRLYIDLFPFSSNWLRLSLHFLKIFFFFLPDANFPQTVVISRERRSQDRGFFQPWTCLLNAPRCKLCL